MLQRRRPPKSIETFDEQLDSLSSDDRTAFVAHVRRRLDELDDQDKAPENENKILSRVCLLSILLILQSGSSFILQSFSDLISRHILITMYLTMLVGAGGNAGTRGEIEALIEWWKLAGVDVAVHETPLPWFAPAVLACAAVPARPLPAQPCTCCSTPKLSGVRIIAWQSRALAICETAAQSTSSALVADAILRANA